MIYESTISDILGIIAFYAVLSMVGLTLTKVFMEKFL